MSQFTIMLGGNQVKAEQAGEKKYTVHKEGGDMHLLVKEDSDGASRWLDASTDNETPQSQEAGRAIEAHLANKNKV